MSVVLYSNFTLKPKLTLAFRGGKRKTWSEKHKKKASLKWINEALNKYGSYLLSQHNASIRQRRTWGTYAPLAHRNGKRKTWWEKHKKKPHWNESMRLSINMAATYSPSIMRVPSAMGDLTSLFGMGRGEHPRQNHHKLLRLLTTNNVHIGKLIKEQEKK